MSKLSLTLFIASVGFAGCAGAEDTDQGPAQLDGAPQQAQVGTLPAAPAKSTDPRLLNCQLEYEAFAPAFAVKTAGSFETTFGAVENTGAFASDGAFRLDVVTNKTPPYNLSFIAEISSEATHASLSYIVLPRPHVGGAFLFELGATIAPVTLDGASFDHLRAYCSIRMP